MSTSSHIGIRDKDEVKYIYCHSDGNLKYNGMLLNLFYRKPERVEKLINLGDISCLGYNVEAPRVLNDRQDAFKLALYMNLHTKTSFTISYCRDCNYKYSDVKPHIARYTDNSLYSQSYTYLYDLAKKKWFVVYKLNGVIKEYELDKLFTDNEYHADFKRETRDYEKFSNLEKALNAFIYEKNTSILAKYNEFLGKKGIMDVEFDYCINSEGKRVYGLFIRKNENSLRRTVISRSACIGDLLMEVLEKKGKNFYL